jgi:hypothetical protein
MSDTKRCSGADSENMRENNYKKYIRGSAQCQKCSATVAPIEFQANANLSFCDAYTSQDL